MNFYQKNGLAKIMKKKREEKTRIKKEFIETGAADFISKSLKKKYKSKYNISDIPF